MKKTIGTMMIAVGIGIITIAWGSVYGPFKYDEAATDASKFKLKGMPQVEKVQFSSADSTHDQLMGQLSREADSRLTQETMAPKFDMAAKMGSMGGTDSYTIQIPHSATRTEFIVQKEADEWTSWRLDEYNHCRAHRVPSGFNYGPHWRQIPSQDDAQWFEQEMQRTWERAVASGKIARPNC